MFVPLAPQSERARSEGPDFSTLFDHEYAEADPRAATAPTRSLTDRADAEMHLKQACRAVNAARYGDAVPEVLTPIQAEEAAKLVADWEGVPTLRDVLPTARMAAKLRHYIRRLDIEEREQTEADRAARLARLRAEASPDASAIEVALSTIAAAQDAECFLDGLAPKINSAIAAHLAAEHARMTLRNMCDAADRARAELADMGQRVPPPVKRGEVGMASDNTRRVVESLRAIQGRALSEAAMMRPVSRRRGFGG